MKKEILYEMKSLHRDDFQIVGYRFGSGEKTMAIVGSMRGDEIQQLYVCSQIVAELSSLEAKGELDPDKSILVIPSCNPYSMNVGKRFWAMDGTDINRMFPGYDKGETTQRIAAGIFKHLEGFKYGAQFISSYIPGDYVPHIRMIKTGYEDVTDAKMFGLPYVSLSTPAPFDTALLNYNWQVWSTNAFSVYTGKTTTIDRTDALLTQMAIIRFLKRIGVIKKKVKDVGYDSVVIDEANLLRISAKRAGLFCPLKKAGEFVEKGDVIATITDPNEGLLLEQVISPEAGYIFFSYNKPLVFQNSLIFQLISMED